MRRLIPALVTALAFVAGPASAQELKIDRHVLSSGLTVYTHEDHAAPLMSLHIFYKVGSVTEKVGITGISHLFEHMMFNGSEHFKPKEFDHQLESAGGYNNAYTDRDMTAYYEVFPPDALPLVLNLEADRMASLLVTKENLEQERGIVKEERRLSVENQPIGKLDELLYLQGFVSYPYRNPVVGFMSDLDHISLEDARGYFDTYYAPPNAVAVVSGDFKTADVIKQMEAAFARVKKGGEVHPPYGAEPDQQGERRAVISQESELPMLMIGWHVPGASKEQDVAALDVVHALLGQGDSSRLYQSLVFQKQLVVDLGAENQTYKGPSLFVITLQVAPDKLPADAEAALYEQLEALAKTPVDNAELQKARNQLRANSIRALKTVDGRANEIGRHAITYGDPAALSRLIDLRDKVTAAEVQRVVKSYFTPENRTVITLVPRKAAAGAGGDAGEPVKAQRQEVSR